MPTSTIASSRIIALSRGAYARCSSSKQSAYVILGGIETIHRMGKQQAKYAWHSNLSLAETFEALVA